MLVSAIHVTFVSTKQQEKMFLEDTKEMYMELSLKCLQGEWYSWNKQRLGVLRGKCSIKMLKNKSIHHLTISIYIIDTDLSSSGLHGDDVALGLVEDLDRNSDDRHLEC